LIFDLDQFYSVASSYENPDVTIKCTKKVVEDAGDKGDKGDNITEMPMSNYERENDDNMILNERENRVGTSAAMSPLSPLSPVDNQQLPLKEREPEKEIDDNRTPLQQMKDIIEENRKNIKRDYADHWSCIRCGKHGDHAYVSNHFCSGRKK
jgi:hypothetical protein